MCDHTIEMYLHKTRSAKPDDVIEYIHFGFPYTKSANLDR